MAHTLNKGCHKVLHAQTAMQNESYLSEARIRKEAQDKEL